jgi:cytoskeletal protein RodZ
MYSTGAILDLKVIGQSLRQKRQELNLSLKEVENATSVRIPYLQAIEEGEGDKLISKIYAQGFLKQYACFLGMDGEQILKDYPNLFHHPKTQEFSYGIGTLEMRENPGRHVKWFPNAIWLFAFLALFAFAWYLATFLGVL